MPSVGKGMKQLGLLLLSCAQRHVKRCGHFEEQFGHFLKSETYYVTQSFCSYAFIQQEWGQVWWLTPVIPALWEAEAGGSRGQEIETILANTVKPRLY